MRGWLLDTNVISAFAPGRPTPPATVADWFERNTDQLYICAVTVAEVVAGIAKLRRTGAVTRAAALHEWSERIVGAYADRVLAFDLAAAWIAGELNDASLARGHSPGFADTAIAAIAQSNDLTVLTVNLRHFVPLGVAVVDPFETFARG